MNSAEQARLSWVKSSFSGGSEGGSNCLEVAPLPDGGVAVRNSRDQGHGPVLSYTRAEWDAFLDGCRNGEFDDLVS